MGYAIFTARKLMLQNRLNQLNYRMMVLAQQQQNMTQITTNMEMMNAYRNSSNSIFTSNMMQKSYDELISDTSLDPAAKEIKIANLQQQFKTQEATNTIYALQDMNRLKGVQVVSNQIDLEMKKLDTQVKETTSEMESVEKAEEGAIKASAPKYSAGEKEKKGLERVLFY